MNLVTPTGFRDVLSQEAIAREGITRAVQQLFADRGYLPIETPTLEVMDVMQAGGRLPGSSFKFFDSRGDLLAMRPDVTLQIARMCATRLRNVEGPLRFRYTQRVFRETEADAQADAREMTQFGIELIGEAGVDADTEVVSLFAEAVQTAGVQTFTLAVATVGVLRALLNRSGANAAWKAAVLDAYHASDFVELDRLTSLDASAIDVDVTGVAPAYADAIRALPRIRGGAEAIDAVRALVAPLGCTDGLDDFERVFARLSAAGLAARVIVDFSVMSSFDYYTGVVFAAYSPHVGSPLGSGGRYDHMIGAYGAEHPAAGFAFYLEQVMAAAAMEGRAVGAQGGESDEGLRSGASCSVRPDGTNGRADAAKPSSTPSCGSKPSSPTEVGFLGLSPQSGALDGFSLTLPKTGDGLSRNLRVAVPKGSLNADAIECLAAAGLDTTGLANPGRQLIISNPGVDFIIVRPSDAPVFVALGAADCGICGKDSLLEAAPEVVELVDLKFGECRFVVAEPAGAAESVDEHYRKLGSIRVATKYPNITSAHYAKTGVQVEIVKLHGNIELAPLTGMAERIVDITATGTTLRENNLVIVEEVLSSTARFFANTCAFRTDSRIEALARALARHAEGATYEPIAGKSQ
ncbi:MAG: ATP phosphoribosyltransferase regulatory subunit [Eggerthellaceae bacterium]|nr:ATP phosphoribosyltransferase regulatory subunit [Eggerthellaceae bacterium]